jgi:cation transporter-like permease
VGLAALGTLFTSMIASRLTTELVSDGVPRAQATKIASSASQSQFGSSRALAGHGGAAQAALHAAHDAVAYGMRAVLFGMAGVMAVAFLVALIGLRRGIHHASDADQVKPDENLQPAAEGARL